MKPIPGKNKSKSQYPGTKKNSICLRCLEPLNHLTRLKQDEHMANHMKQDVEKAKQKRLFD